MKAALAIALRDLLKFSRQPVLVFSTVVGPFLTLILLGSAFGGAVTHAPIAIVQESSGPYSSILIRILRSELSCQVGGINCQNSFQLINVPDLDTAERMLHEGLVKGIVYIPLQFDSSLAARSKVTVTVYLDNTDPVSAPAIGSEVGQALQQFSPLIQTSSGDSMIPLQNYNSMPSSSNILYDQQFAYRNVFYIDFLAPGNIIQAIMFVGIIAGGVQLVVDKERGVIEGYLVTPLKKYEIVLGVLISGVAKAMFTACLVFVLAVTVAGVRPMSMFPTLNLSAIALIFVTLFLISLGLISLMTAYAVRSTSADLYRFSLFPMNLILYYTSGAIYPLVGMPKWMQQVAVVNPMTYAVHALRQLMYQGGGLQAVAGDLTFLAVFSGLMLVLAVFAFRRGL
jgi:ABC-2 type transport system permease protein